MSENLRNFTSAVYGMDAVVRRVPEGSWDNPSPCEGWSARDVVVHQIGVLQGAAETIRTGEMALPSPPEEVDDVVQLWHETREAVLEALDHPGRLQQRGRFWFGEMSIDEFIGVVQWDPLTHAWDVAKAVGFEPHIDERVAAASIETIGAMRPNLAKRHLVGDEVPVPEDADVVSRYLGLVGRDPGLGEG